MGSGALTTTKAIGSRGGSCSLAAAFSLGSGTDDAKSFLVASSSSLVAASAASLAAAVFISAPFASLFALTAASLANAPLVLGVGCSAAEAVGLVFFFLPTLTGFFFLVLFLQKMWNWSRLQSKKNS